MTVLWALSLVWASVALVLCVVVWDCRRAERIKDAEAEKAYAEAVRASFAAVEARLEARLETPVPPCVPVSFRCEKRARASWSVATMPGGCEVYSVIRKDVA